MKKFYLVLSVLLIGVVFTSCNKDDEPTIESDGFVSNIMIDGEKVRVDQVSATYTIDSNLRGLHVSIYVGENSFEITSSITVLSGVDLDKVKVGDLISEYPLFSLDSYIYDNKSGDITLKSKDLSKKQLTLQFNNVVMRRLYTETPKDAIITGDITFIYEEEVL